MTLKWSFLFIVSTLVGAFNLALDNVVSAGIGIWTITAGGMCLALHIEEWVITAEPARRGAFRRSMRSILDFITKKFKEKRERRRERRKLLKDAIFAYSDVTRLYWKIVDRHYDDGDLPDELMDEAGGIQNQLIELNERISHAWSMED